MNCVFKTTGRSPTRRPSLLMKSFGFWPKMLAVLICDESGVERAEPPP